MLKYRIRRRVAAATRSAIRLAEIEASVRALADDDLLDLADIFVRGAPTPLKELTTKIMVERGIRL